MKVCETLKVLREMGDLDVILGVDTRITETERRRGWRVVRARWSHRWKWAGSDGWGFDCVEIETGGDKGPIVDRIVAMVLRGVS